MIIDIIIVDFENTRLAIGHEFFQPWRYARKTWIHRNMHRQVTGYLAMFFDGLSYSQVQTCYTIHGKVYSMTLRFKVISDVSGNILIIL